MATPKIRAAARVQVTLEVITPGAWGPDCTVEQIQKQAAEEAIQMVRGGLAIDGLQAAGVRPRGSAKVLDAKVQIIMASTEEG